MVEPRLKPAATPNLLPWQAALMIVCVTAAGLFHEHPQAVQPALRTLQPSPLRSGLHHADLLNATVWPRR